jgi:glutaredoxin
MNPVEFTKPSETEFTIYSKSGCVYCRNVKELLESKQINYKMIDCDEYLIENKKEFLFFIETLSNREWTTFPIVFNKNQFIGGFNDTKEYLEKTLDFNDDF